MSIATYRVRPGFTYTDTSGARPRTYGAGEELVLAGAVGDAAHALQRVSALASPAGRPSRRNRKGGDDADE